MQYFRVFIYVVFRSPSNSFHSDYAVKTAAHFILYISSDRRHHSFFFLFLLQFTRRNSATIISLFLFSPFVVLLLFFPHSVIPCRPVVPSLNCVSVGLDHPYLEAFCRLPTLVGLQMFQPLSFPTFHIVPYRFVLLGKTSLTGDDAAVCLRSLTLRGNLQMFSTLTVSFRFVRMKYHLPGDDVVVCLHTPFCLRGY